MNTKTSILAAAALGLATVSSYAQGTITFLNTSTTLVTTNSGGNTGSAALTSTSGIKVALFYQPNNGGAAPTAIDLTGAGVGNWEAVGGLASISPLVGRFNDSTVTTGSDINTGANTGNVWLIAVAWNGNATSYANAFSGVSTLVGESTIWSQSSGNPNALPSATPPVSTAGFTGLVLTPVPEPTTIALAGLGAASLLLFRRRK